MDFLPESTVIIPFALAVFVIAITPGPDMTLFVGRALSQGRAAGLACMFGAMTGIMIHTLLVALGLSALLAASPQAFLVLKIGGAAYLLFLAYQAIRHGSAFSPDKVARPGRSLLRNWATGLGINLLNPKIVLFFMTFLPQFVSPGDPHAAQKLVFLGLLFIPLSLPITVPMVLAADAFSAFLRRAPKVMRAIDYLFAGVFAAFALRILTTQAR
jgi:threonine/homoserine/homoserine lactone efflux protein